MSIGGEVGKIPHSITHNEEGSKGRRPARVIREMWWELNSLNLTRVHILHLLLFFFHSSWPYTPIFCIVPFQCNMQHLRISRRLKLLNNGIIVIPEQENDGLFIMVRLVSVQRHFILYYELYASPKSTYIRVYLRITDVLLQWCCFSFFSTGQWIWGF